MPAPPHATAVPRSRDGAARAAPLAARLWAYQRERFPLAAYVPLIGVSAVSAAAWSRAARGAAGPVGWGTVAAGALTAVVVFFLLRVADEHKDAETDRRWRPELPVPRGLVSLAELRRVALAAALVAVVANALAAPRLFLAFGAVAAWAGLMTREFFAPAWLRARPAAYLLSHMGVMPLLFLSLTGLDWLAAGEAPPAALGWFLALAFLNGILVEVGRKLRAPADEREGVETYTRAWGPRAAPAVWLAALAGAAAAAWMAARGTAGAGPAAVALPVLLAAAALPAVRFLREPSPGAARATDAASGLWTLLSYLLLGAGPWLAEWTAR